MLNAKPFQMTESERIRFTMAAQRNADDRDRDYVVFFDTSGALRIEAYNPYSEAHTEEYLFIVRPSRFKPQKDDRP